MFKKDDKVKVIEGTDLLKGKSGVVLEANDKQVKVKVNLGEDNEVGKYLVNIFENNQVELESLDLLTEDTVTFDNDLEPENINENTMWTFQCEQESALGVAEAKNALLCTENGYTGIHPYEAYSIDYDKEVAYVTYIPKDKADLDNAEDYVIVTEFPVEEFFDYGKWYRKLRNIKEGYTTNTEAIDEIENQLKNKNESLKLNEEELKAWCSDNDANYYTQDIKDDKVIIRGLKEDLAEYDFKTKELKVFDYSGTTTPEEDEVEFDDNYIRDYVYDIDMEDEKTEIPSWEFVSVIATAENIKDEDVISEAHDRGFKVFLIQAANYEKVAVASEKITEQDIYDDFASYLEGNAKVTELI